MSFIHVQLSQEERDEIRRKDRYIEGEKNGILKTARKMKAINLPLEQIMEVTGLSKEEIEKL